MGFAHDDRLSDCCAAARLARMPCCCKFSLPTTSLIKRLVTGSACFCQFFRCKSAGRVCGRLCTAAAGETAVMSCTGHVSHGFACQCATRRLTNCIACSGASDACKKSSNICHQHFFSSTTANQAEQASVKPNKVLHPCWHCHIYTLQADVLCQQRFRCEAQ